MKISEFIGDLNLLLEEHGDLEVVLSSDPEGNDHYTVERPFASVDSEMSYAPYSRSNVEPFEAIVIYPSARLDEYYKGE